GGRQVARIAQRPSTRDKRRNRRRKSKYRKKVVSLPHFLVALMFALGMGFVLALAKGASSSGDLTLHNVNTQRLSDLNLPGVAPQQARRPLGALQFLVWGYVFGTPLIFGLLRVFYWREMLNGARYFSVTALAAWLVVVCVVAATTL
ncbi:MAG: hypothetical protein VX463_03250, partial [Pseudomonadota bacterium]|nr:hypothetical protein [Pseudomonadota bacterium]